jgi:hypothetical protein
MTMRFYLGAIITALILLFSAACNPKLEINRELTSLPLNAVARAEIEVDINNGILIINNGTHNLLDGEFSYSAIDQRPVVIYHQDGDIAQIAIRQPPGNSVFSRSHNEWKLYLSNDIPIHLTLKHGSGIHTLSLGGLSISGLEVISSGAGILLLDLAGFWEEDLDILVRGVQGTALTITSPQGTGTRIETESRIRKIDQGNFLREQDAFINTAYKGDGPKLNVKLQGNFGNLSLESGFPSDMPVHVALGLAQTMFSKGEVFDCSSEPQERQPLPNDTVRELWFDYLCHRGPEHRILDGSDVLTQDLAASELVDRIRRQFYAGEPLDEATLYFNIPEFLSATVDMAAVIQSRQQYEFSITHFIGSFDYSVSREGDRVRYEIRNQTDRSSGTHIPLRFPEGGYTLSLEELVREKPMLANAFLLEVIHSGKYPIISILEAKSRADTAADEGGGNFAQTFTWTERDLGLTELPPWPTYLIEIDIK